MISRERIKNHMVNHILNQNSNILTTTVQDLFRKLSGVKSRPDVYIYIYIQDFSSARFASLSSKSCPNSLLVHMYRSTGWLTLGQHAPLRIWSRKLDVSQKENILKLKWYGRVNPSEDFIFWLTSLFISKIDTQINWKCSQTRNASIRNTSKVAP